MSKQMVDRSRWQTLIIVVLICLSYACQTKDQRSVPLGGVVGLDSTPYNSILASALTQDTLRDTAAFRELEQWVRLESGYPGWGFVSGDSIQYLNGNLLLWFTEATGVSLGRYVFIADTNLKEIVDGLCVELGPDVDQSAASYDWKSFLLKEDSIMVVKSRIRLVHDETKPGLPDEVVEWERAVVYLINRGRFRRVDERWRDSMSLQLSWEQFR